MVTELSHITYNCTPIPVIDLCVLDIHLFTCQTLSLFVHPSYLKLHFSEMGTGPGTIPIDNEFRDDYKSRAQKWKLGQAKAYRTRQGIVPLV